MEITTLCLPVSINVHCVPSQCTVGELTITQAPNPVGSKGNVTLTCSGVGIRPKDLIWKDSNGEVMEAGKTLGVETIMERPKSRDLVLNMQNFTSEATVSCEVEDKELRQNFSICGEPCCRHNLFQLFCLFCAWHYYTVIS